MRSSCFAQGGYACLRPRGQPLTGEPYAGEPHVRFGGRRGRVTGPAYPYQKKGASNSLVSLGDRLHRVAARYCRRIRLWSAAPSGAAFLSVFHVIEALAFRVVFARCLFALAGWRPPRETRVFRSVIVFIELPHDIVGEYIFGVRRPQAPLFCRCFTSSKLLPSEWLSLSACLLWRVGVRGEKAVPTAPHSKNCASGSLVSLGDRLHRVAA
jgi:hypothetical protein